MQWTESVGLTLVNRDLTSMQLRTPGGQILTYRVLQMFPFTSESKRMGVIVRVGAACPHAGLLRASEGHGGAGPPGGSGRSPAAAGAAPVRAAPSSGGSVSSSGHVPAASASEQFRAM